MAAAAFRSTTRRSAVGSGTAEDAGSSNRVPAGAIRWSRSLSRYSSRFPPPSPEHDEFPTPGFAEISLADLADKFFRAREATEEFGPPPVGRSGGPASDVSPRVETGSSLHWGRSVSRCQGQVAPEIKGGPDGEERRRRSISVARYQCSDSEVFL